MKADKIKQEIEQTVLDKSLDKNANCNLIYNYLNNLKYSAQLFDFTVEFDNTLRAFKIKIRKTPISLYKKFEINL